jgi:gluconolactonase
MDNLQTVAPRIERLDRRLAELLPTDARVERIVHGFSWLEGPLWLDSKQILLFSDIPGNVIRSWSAQAGTHVFLEKSGYTGETPFAGREPGSNGLALDRDGRLLIAEHGNRRITRLKADGSRTVLVDDYRGKRLNSPNDLTVAADGSIYFTDPPFGLPDTFDDPGKELSFSGVFRRSPEGELTLLTDEVRAPNGIAFSPDGRTLYVSNAEHSNPVWYAFHVNADGTLGERRIFQDATRFVTQYQGVPDGMKVDAGGNVFGSGPGGVYIFAPDGTHLGTIVIGGATSNVAFGSGYLFITAGEAVYRVGLR